MRCRAEARRFTSAVPTCSSKSLREYSLRVRVRCLDRHLAQNSWNGTGRGSGPRHNFPYHPEARPTPAEAQPPTIGVLIHVKPKFGVAAGKVKKFPGIDHGHSGNMRVRPARRSLPSGHGAVGHTRVLQFGFGRKPVFLPRRLRQPMRVGIRDLRRHHARLLLQSMLNREQFQVVAPDRSLPYPERAHADDMHRPCVS